MNSAELLAAEVAVLDEHLCLETELLLELSNRCLALVGEVHGAVFAAGAAEGDGDRVVVVAVLEVAGQREPQQALEGVQERYGPVLTHEEDLHLGIRAGLRAQRLDVVRVLADPDAEGETGRMRGRSG